MTEFDFLLRAAVLMLLAILFVGLLLKKLNQPYFVAYIIVGILLGPSCFKVIAAPGYIHAVGEFGLLLQMFFIGTEIEIRSLVRQINKPVLGVLCQLVFSFLFICVLGYFQEWTIQEILLFTVIISLSSSAIILEYLQKNNELNKPLGLLTSGILIMQDIMLIPVLLLLNLFSNKTQNTFHYGFLFIAVTSAAVIFRQVILKRRFQWRYPRFLQEDTEAQVFTGLLICFGFAWLTYIIHLSAAVGALLGGMFISRSQSMKWLTHHLAPFRIFFFSLFFLSIGLQIQLSFLKDHFLLVAAVTVIILIVNSAINAIIFRMMNETWRNSIYAGALLSQIGEFSLVLCLVANSIGMLNQFWYQLTLSVISITMLATSIWIGIIRAFIYQQASHVRQSVISLSAFFQAKQR